MFRGCADLGLPVDSHSYHVGAQILTALGLSPIRLMTDNPAKLTELTGYRLKIVERVPLVTKPNAGNIHYLRARQQELSHFWGLTEGAPSGTVS